MTSLKWTISAVAYAGVVFLAVQQAAAQDMPSDVRIVTSNAGGSFYPVGVALAQVLGEQGITASAEPGGGNSNVISVSQGSADIGFTFGPTVVMAAQGQEPFPSEFTNLRALGTLYNNFTQIAVTEGSGVTEIAALEGQPFATQGQSAASSTFFRMLLEANGLSEDDLDIVIRGGPAQGANAVRDRASIGFQATTGYPNASFSEAFLSVPMRLLPVGEDAANSLMSANPGFSRAVIPAGVYEGQEETPTVSAATILIVNEDMSEEHAYQIVKVLAENAESISGMHGALSGLDAERMSNVAGIELHPGAARYFEEAGLD